MDPAVLSLGNYLISILFQKNWSVFCLEMVEDLNHLSRIPVIPVIYVSTYWNHLRAMYMLRAMNHMRLCGVPRPEHEASRLELRAQKNARALARARAQCLNKGKISSLPRRIRLSISYIHTYFPPISKSTPAVDDFISWP